MSTFPALPTSPLVRTSSSLNSAGVSRLLIVDRIGSGPEKTNLLKHTENMENLSVLLPDLSRAPADSIMPYLIRLQKLIDDVSDFISQYDDKRQVIQDMDTARIKTMVNLFERELRRYSSSLPSHLATDSKHHYVNQATELAGWVAQRRSNAS